MKWNIKFDFHYPKGMMCSTLRIPIGAVVSRDESENENLYTSAADINLSTYGTLSYNDDDGYDDDDFDDVDPEFEEHVDSVNPPTGNVIFSSFGFSLLFVCYFIEP